MIYFTAAVATDTTPVKVADAERIDRAVYFAAGSVRIGFTNLITPSTGFTTSESNQPVVLPGGEELWAVSGSAATVIFLVTSIGR